MASNTSPILSIAADRMRRVRQNLNLSQNEVETKLGLPKAIVSRWETGAQEPRMSEFVAMSRLYRVHPNYLVGLTDDPAIELPAKPTYGWTRAWLESNLNDLSARIAMFKHRGLLEEMNWLEEELKWINTCLETREYDDDNVIEGV